MGRRRWVWASAALVVVRGDVLVGLNVSTTMAAPVLHVRVGECGSSRPRCEADEAVAWHAAEAVWKGSRLGVASYEVSFADYSGGLSSHLLFVRVEYSSRKAALRSLEASGEPSFVGAAVQGAWPLVVPASGSGASLRRKPCKNGQSFQGRGRWLRTRERRLWRRLRRRNKKQAWQCAGDPRREWSWMPDACAPKLASGRDEALDCVAGHLVIMGDSVMRQVAERLHSCLGGALTLWRIKGPMPRGLEMAENLLHSHAANVSAGRVPKGGILVFNVAGLWQVAYGELDDYEDAVVRLAALAASIFDAVLLASTTAVHPVHYLLGNDARNDTPRLVDAGVTKISRRLKSRVRFADEKRGNNDNAANVSDLVKLQAQRKRAMTLPRVDHVARVESRVAAHLNIPVLDLFSPSLAREDDPFDPTDMRHYGPSTVAEFANLLLASLCNLPRPR